MGLAWRATALLAVSTMMGHLGRYLDTMAAARPGGREECENFIFKKKNARPLFGFRYRPPLPMVMATMMSDPIQPRLPVVVTTMMSAPSMSMMSDAAQLRMAS